MKRNKILTNLAPALLLLAAAFGTAGCSQSDDALTDGGVAVRGGEPLRISVAPKPGFTDGNNAPGTRGTVADDGTFSWTAWNAQGTGDCIYYYITFNDAAATKFAQSCVYDPGQDTFPFFADWLPKLGWAINSASQPKLPVWPVGANRATVQAFYTDCKYIGIGGSDENPTSLTFDYSQGTGDHMICNKTINIGQPLVIDFEHRTTRLVFKGLTPGTAYSLKVNGTAVTFPTLLSAADFSLGTPAEQTFTADADGKLVICTPLNAAINADDGKVTVELMTGGVTIGTGELTAKGATPDYVMDGNIYTINVKSSGEIAPDGWPDLLSVKPIVPGNKVYEVNGYWVTAPDANESKGYQWATDADATVMGFDPCAGHGNWQMPTMYDFEKMADWTDSWPWSQDASGEEREIVSDNDIWYAAFPDGLYWSSVERGSDSNACGMYSNSQNYNSARYFGTNKTSECLVRCVQKQ